MVMKAGNNIELYMGPDILGAPDNLEDAITKFIGGAKKRLWIAVQELDNEAIAQAILDAKVKRKVTVSVVLESDYLRSGTTRPDPWKPGGGLEPNRRIQNALLRAGIRVYGDFNTKILHQKFSNLRFFYPDHQIMPIKVVLAEIDSTDIGNFFIYYDEFFMISERIFDQE